MKLRAVRGESVGRLQPAKGVGRPPAPNPATHATSPTHLTGRLSVRFHRSNHSYRCTMRYSSASFGYGSCLGSETWVDATGTVGPAWYGPFVNTGGGGSLDTHTHMHTLTHTHTEPQLFAWLFDEAGLKAFCVVYPLRAAQTDVEGSAELW